MYLQKTPDVEINRSFVDLMICFAYNDNEFLGYSSHCITISALAVDIRTRKGFKSFDVIMTQSGLSSSALNEEVSKCSEILYDKVLKMSNGSSVCCHHNHDVLDMSD